MKRRIFIDTDTASDDAVALLMAFEHFESSLVGIGVVAGNVPLQQGVQNAMFVRDLVNMLTPVYAGASEPIARPLETAQNVHGQDGMGDIGLPIGQNFANQGHAVDALIDAADRYSGSLELVTLGPLTNIALAISEKPEIVHQIKRCFIMGGTSDNIGNVTPFSEFNMWVDPEAADIVFRSCLRKVMIGWDISRKYAVINDEEAQILRSLGTEKARVAVDSQKVLRQFCEQETGIDGFDLPDPIAMSVVFSDEAVIRSIASSVRISLEDGSKRGMTIIDHRDNADHEKTTVIVLECNRQYFMDKLTQSLR
mgnify:CR=1 FL=1